MKRKTTDQIYLELFPRTEEDSEGWPTKLEARAANDIIEWHRTGILPPYSMVNTLAVKLHEELDTPDYPLSLAEKIVTDRALKYMAYYK